MSRGPRCRVCRVVRLVVAVVVLGAGSGFLVVWLGGSSELSMLATFVGALVPVLVHVRAQRPDEPRGR